MSFLFFCLVGWFLVLFFLLSKNRKFKMRSFPVWFNSIYVPMKKKAFPMEKKRKQKTNEKTQHLSTSSIPASCKNKHLTYSTISHTSLHVQKAVREDLNIFSFVFKLWLTLFPLVFWRSRLPGQCILLMI